MSSRSVRYIISKINEHKQIIDSSNKGYLLIGEADKPFAHLTSISSGPEERKKFIIDQLIIHNKVINIDDISNFFHISPTTLMKYLPDLKKDLAENKLYLKTKRNNIYVIGKERDKQKFAVKLIRDEIGHTSFSLENIQRYFLTANLKDIKNIVIGVFTKYQYFLDDYSLLNYILHLAVCVELSEENGTDQTKTTLHTSLVEQLQPFASEVIISMVSEITDHLNTLYGSSFSLENIIDSSILMSTRIKERQDTDADIDRLENVVGRDVRYLINEIASAINDKYSLDLGNKQMMVRFALHLKNMLTRINNNIPIQAIQFVNIKNEYPFLYDLAVYVSYIIHKKTQFKLPENEIAYIALHLGVMIEQEATITNKLTCVILSTDYYAIGKKLFKKISRIFEEDLFVQNLFTNLEDYGDVSSDVDLIISTYPISNINVPHIIVGPFLNEHNISELRKKIEDIKISKRKNYILSILERFLKEDLCFFGRNFQSADDAIEVICDYMIKKGYVNKIFKKEIYEHENIAPSSYGNIAIAHTFSNSTLPSVIAMSINPTPITWGDNNVNIVLIFSLNKKDNKLFREIFTFMTDIISNSQAFTRIMTTSNYNELIEILLFYV